MREGRPSLTPAAVERLSEFAFSENEAPARPEHAGYDIVQEIGRGGMGTVYRAFDRKLRRPVAMKVVHQPSAAWRDRFEREAMSTARLDHPNIVSIFDYGTLEDGRPYYTMKEVEGRSLRELVRDLHDSEDPLPRLASFLRLVCQVCSALAYAHERGVVHRDLKPDNIMVADFNQVWVLDWGLALVDGESAYNTGDGASTVSGPEDDIRALTHSGEILGTPAYMAPEQATGASAAIGPAADIYSVGSILHEILSGRPAFAERGQDEVIAMKRAGEVPPLRSDSFPIPPPLVSIVRRAMMKEPQDRYADAGALADDLCHWMDGLPVLAHRESRFEQAARLMRRYRVPIALVVCYLVVRTGLFVLLRR